MKKTDRDKQIEIEEGKKTKNEITYCVDWSALSFVLCLCCFHNGIKFLAFVGWLVLCFYLLEMFVYVWRIAVEYVLGVLFVCFSVFCDFVMMAAAAAGGGNVAWVGLAFNTFRMLLCVTAPPRFPNSRNMHALICYSICAQAQVQTIKRHFCLRLFGAIAH